MEDVLFTGMNESEKAQLEKILDRCIADMKAAHAYLVKGEAQFQQTQAEIEALLAQPQKGRINVEQILRDGTMASTAN